MVDKSPSAAPKGAGIRSAEKDRVSTCTLADEIANSVICKYRLVTEKSDVQSVLAGIVATIHDSQIEVISFATGNRFDQVVSSSLRGNNLRDCHAEVLARRAFKHWLINEWVKLQTKSGESFFFVLSDNFKLVLKDGIKIFLYVSSAPCGNACIRKWGQPKKEIFREDLGSLQLPEDKHDVFHAHAKQEGQTALSYKGATSISSCSDKILKWNVLGLQGSRLRELCECPLKADGIVIGRKFAHVHARRAFCCRLDTKGIHPAIRNNVHHPVLMCTAIKFDEGTYDAGAGQGAMFQSDSCWWILGDVCEHLDGNTGFLRDSNTESKLSPLSLHSLTSSLKIPTPSESTIRMKELLVSELEKM